MIRIATGMHGGRNVDHDRVDDDAGPKQRESAEGVSCTSHVRWLLNDSSDIPWPTRECGNPCLS